MERDILSDSLMNAKLKSSIYLIIEVFTMTFHSFNASLLNESINKTRTFKNKKITDPKLLNSIVYCDAKIIFYVNTVLIYFHWCMIWTIFDNLRVQTNLNIEKIILKVVQIKS